MCLTAGKVLSGTRVITMTRDLRERQSAPERWGMKRSLPYFGIAKATPTACRTPRGGLLHSLSLAPVAGGRFYK